MGRFFPGPVWKVPASYVWRWRAACRALRDIIKDGM